MQVRLRKSFWIFRGEPGFSLSPLGASRRIRANDATYLERGPRDRWVGNRRRRRGRHRRTSDTRKSCGACPVPPATGLRGPETDWHLPPQKGPVMGMTGWPPCRSRPRVARLSAYRRDARPVRRATIQICKQWDSLEYWSRTFPRSRLLVTSKLESLFITSVSKGRDLAKSPIPPFRP